MPNTNIPTPVPVTYSITINYHKTASSSITDLTGTKWLFKDNEEITGTKLTANINFTSNSNNYTSLSITGSFPMGDIQYNNIFVYQLGREGMEWVNQAYRTISITGGTDATNSSFISWLQANATQIEDPEPEPEPEPTPSNPNLTDIFTDVANAIRAKTGKSDPLYPVNFANEIATIETGGGGAELNIHYSSTTAPSDTSKLWVKTDTEPVKVSVSKSIGSVETLSTTLPTATYEIASGVVGSKTYLFGGRTSPSAYSNEIYCFDTTSETITTISVTLPATITRTASGVVGTKIYLFGGQTGSSTYSNEIYCFDTTNETLNTLSVTLPVAISEMASGVVGNKIYLFGGYLGSGCADTIYCFDTTNKTLTTLSATLPVALREMTSAVVGTKIYLFGGYNNSKRFKTIYCFDTTNKTLTTLSATLPALRQSMASGVVGTKIYLFGGTSGTSPAPTIYCFDTIDETIATLNVELPEATDDIASGVVGSNIYLFGGMAGVGFASSSSNKIRRYVAIFTLVENSLLLLDTGSNSFNLIDSNELVIEAKPKEVYIGNTNNEAEYVESALYVNGSWQPIG